MLHRQSRRRDRDKPASQRQTWLFCQRCTSFLTSLPRLLTSTPTDSSHDDQPKAPSCVPAYELSEAIDWPQRIQRNTFK